WIALKLLPPTADECRASIFVRLHSYPSWSQQVSEVEVCCITQHRTCQSRQGSEIAPTGFSRGVLSREPTCRLVVERQKPLQPRAECRGAARGRAQVDRKTQLGYQRPRCELHPRRVPPSQSRRLSSRCSLRT